MNERAMPFLALLGRILLGQIFFLSGVMKLMNWNATADSMANHGMVAVPFFLFMSILFEVGGGLCLIAGFQTRWASLALFLFLIPVTLVFHNFWKYEGAEMQNQMQHFMKNLTIMGGLMMAAFAGAGRYSLDHLLWARTPLLARSTREEMAEALTH